MTTNYTAFGRPVILALVVACCMISLSGCKSGTTTDLQQSCKSTGGLLSGRKVSCTGSVGTAKGEPSVEIINTDGDLSGNYKLDATVEVGKGEARAYVDTSGGGKQGGKVSPDKPLHIGAVVSIDEEDDEVSVNLKVLGKQVENLSYEATVTPQD